MELPLLQDIVIILGLSILIVLIFQRLKLSSILGFLVTGAIAGPHGLSLINGVHEVELLSEIGIIFLLFVIGIEFSVKGLSSIKNIVIGGGILQVTGTILVTAASSYALGLPIRQAIFMGFLFSLSSTAIVLKLLQEKGELNTPHGRVGIAILIFQDIIVVPMMLLTPILAGQLENPLQTIFILVIKVVVVIGIILVLARYVVPRILNLVVKTNSRELFILTVIVLCFSTAWLTSSVGLSLAIGAFFAGLIISESEYSHQATANILPFREIFISFFFVSIGMLLQFDFFLNNIFLIVALAAGVIFAKAIVASLSVVALGYPARTNVFTGLLLFQVGEFSFLLSMTGMEYGLISESVYQYFLSISIISMGITPFVFNNSSTIADYIIRAPLPGRVRKRLESFARIKIQHTEETKDYRDHLVIIGYGVNGENVSKAARHANIPYLIIELGSEAFHKAKANNEPVVFGDAGDETILKHAHIQNARVIVIAISDPEATKKIVNRIRQFTETAYLIIRTRYVKETHDILKMGADEVIPEEFETSIEIFTRVLNKFLVPTEAIENFTNHIRSNSYEMLRSIYGSDKRGGIEHHIPDMEIITLKVREGKNNIVGKPLGESGLRVKYGVNILAIKRDNKYITKISPDTVIEPDDILYLLGKQHHITELNKHLKKYEIS